MTVVDLYTIQIIHDAALQLRLSSSLPVHVTDEGTAALMAEAEENLTDLLPAGYRARIRRWDHPDEETQEEEDE